MAALKYRDEHNKVGFLEKPKGSTDYHQVLDFLRGLHISSKSGSWDQFGSQVAIALIFLTEGRRFLQMILEIEPRNTKQYHAFETDKQSYANDNLNFQGDHMLLLGTMLLPAQAAIAGESSGEAAPSHPQTVLETITEPDHSHDHASTPPRPTTTTFSALVNEQGPSSDPHISSSRPHESAPDLFTSTNVEMNTSPPSQESEFKAYKLLFKEVVGNLRMLRKMWILLSSSSNGTATAAAASAVPTGGSHETDIPPSSSIPSDKFAGDSANPAGASTGPSADSSNKGKSSLLEEDPPVRERTFRHRGKTDSDWNDIMSQVHANQGLTADLLGPDVNDDNFAERMVALIAQRRREFAAQRFQDKRNKPLTYART
ncbi:hypothetical protein Tco_0088392 [Tanacetum coccineum]